MWDAFAAWRPAGEGCEGLSVPGTACGGRRRGGLGGVSCFLENAGSVAESDTWFLLQGQLGLGTVVVCSAPGRGAFICITFPLEAGGCPAPFLFLARFFSCLFALVIPAAFSLPGLNLICPAFLRFPLAKALREELKTCCVAVERRRKECIGSI